jgi:hypothetical protein
LDSRRRLYPRRIAAASAAAAAASAAAAAAATLADDDGREGAREGNKIPCSGRTRQEGAGNREVHAEREQEERDRSRALPALSFYALFVTTLPPIGSSSSSSSSSLGNGWAPWVLGGSALAARGVRIGRKIARHRYNSFLVQFERHSRDEGRAGSQVRRHFSGNDRNGRHPMKTGRRTDGRTFSPSFGCRMLVNLAACLPACLSPACLSLPPWAAALNCLALPCDEKGSRNKPERSDGLLSVESLQGALVSLCV